MTSCKAIIDLLKDKPVAYRPSLKPFAGSVGATIMLCQAIYWQDRVPRSDGWWWKTAKEWEQETGLNTNEQRRARAKLCGTSFWQETRKGIPARMWFKVDLEEMARVLVNGLDPLSAKEIVEIHEIEIKQIAKSGLMRAKKKDPKTMYVDYVAIVIRDKAICCICGESITRGPGQLPDSLHFHHKQSLSQGGKHTLENIGCAHAKCNLVIGDEETSSIILNKQEHLGQTNKNAYANQTNPENTSENTTEHVADDARVSVGGDLATQEWIEELENQTPPPRNPPRSAEEMREQLLETEQRMLARQAQEPCLTWGVESEEMQRQVQRFGDEAYTVLRLGYELDRALGLRPIWNDRKKVKTWTSGLSACLAEADGDWKMVVEAARVMRENKLSIKNPYSIEGMVADAAAKGRGSQQPSHIEVKA